MSDLKTVHASHLKTRAPRLEQRASRLEQRASRLEQRTSRLEQREHQVPTHPTRKKEEGYYLWGKKKD